MKQLPKMNISHPLAHCEARKAWYYNWVEKANMYQPGNRLRLAAHAEYRKHVEEDCEICIAHEEGQSASRKRELFMDSDQRPAAGGRVPTGDAV
jgi:hypothetical protein